MRARARASTVTQTFNSLKIDLNDGALKNFYEEAKDLSFVERGELLMKETNEIIDAHKQLAKEGQTQAPPEDEPVVHHFVTFVDGCKSAPINHGPTTKEAILDNAAKVCK
ncbi:Similar to Uch: Ubiquitin carboxyl-terminal hydrolase (Drosophila melanogaster) [Cotesia congregata]|uniref:ubiquitinyl hydrolase 1 n=1 Tax=Cotesia congregata TaxID=51543 RepID=A0A8J2H7Y1_COTCN|nr:Similar to Uch: Ubiquitin carboxyl-terminal hydrolase (Drosophila melanogaster) [Cotesia congregata]